MTDTTTTTAATPKQKIASLLVIYLKALMQSPGFSEAEYLEAEEYLKQIASAL